MAFVHIRCWCNYCFVVFLVMSVLCGICMSFTWWQTYSILI